MGAGGSACPSAGAPCSPPLPPPYTHTHHPRPAPPQSYGSRYTRPPIISGDVSRAAPMTVHEFRLAQALTARPVKGMLTGEAPPARAWRYAPPPKKRTHTHHRPKNSAPRAPPCFNP